MTDIPVTTTKVRVSFEVDMARYLPKTLKPHDAPLEAWVEQAVFDLFFKQLEVDAINRRFKIATTGDPDLCPRKLAALDRDMALYQQVAENFTVEMLANQEQENAPAPFA